MGALEVIPSAIRLEASSFCQLRCPSCPTTSKAIHPAIGSGFLKLADFQQLIDANPELKDIELSNYGEIFLNPDMLEILKYAHQRQVALRADNGANLNSIRDDVLEGLVKYGFKSMTCSIDGASQETYERYRVRGNFEKVIATIRKLNAFKLRYRSEYPRLTWQFVVFGHNEHELPAARKLARELGMGFYAKLSWDPKFSPVQDRELVRREAGAATREEYRQLHQADYMLGICHQLWDRPQINWDGKNLGCCRNFWGDFGGNAFQDGLLQTVNSEKMQYARGMLLGSQPPRDDIPCTTCQIYIDMRATGSWLQRTVRLSPERRVRLSPLRRVLQAVARFSGLKIGG